MHRIYGIVTMFLLGVPMIVLAFYRKLESMERRRKVVVVARPQKVRGK
jgi:hypothetical protein